MNVGKIKLNERREAQTDHGIILVMLFRGYPIKVLGRGL